MAATANDLISDILAGRPGAVNALLSRFGREVADYAAALVTNPGPDFDKLLEDIFVDILAQCRVLQYSDRAAGASDATLRDFVFESAVRTARARHTRLLQAGAAAGRSSKDHVTLEEALDRSGMSETELRRLVSEGRVAAVRADDTLRFRAADLPLRGAAVRGRLEVLAASDRELLSLHFRLGFAPEKIGGWLGLSGPEVELRIGKAAETLVRQGLVRESFA